MPEQLRNILQFRGLAVGVASSQAHNLNVAGTAVPPDVYAPSAPGFTIAVDAVNVTVTRTANAASGDVDVLVWYWHSVERGFGPFAAYQPAALTGSPFLVQAAGAGVFDPARTIVVSESGGDAQTITAGIAAANALVPPPDADNPASILVYPGVYQEDPLTVPAGVVLFGYSLATCIVEATTATAPLVTLSPDSEVIGVTLRGANGVGGIGLNMQAAGRGYGRGVLVRDCTTAYLATGAAASLFVGLCVAAREVGEAMTTAFEAAAGGTLEALTPHIGGAAAARITYGFHATGAGSDLHAYSLDVEECEHAFYAEQNGVIHALGGLVHDCIYNFHVGATGSIHATGVCGDDIDTYGLWLEAGTGDFKGVGNTIDSDQISIGAGASVISQHLSEYENDEAQMVIGEHAVGMPLIPTQSIVGEGDSHVRGMLVFRNTNGEAGTWSDITTYLVQPAGDTALFPGTGAGNCFYVGASEKEFPGIWLEVSSAGAGLNLAWEYWNGAAWTAFRIMPADDGPPYASRSPYEAMTAVGTENIRFNADEMTGWAQKSLDGSTRWWMRCRALGVMMSGPRASQLKLHTNAHSVNGDGMVERFGTSIAVRPIPYHKLLLETFTGAAAPGNNNQTLTANITINATQNVLADNNHDGLGGVFTLPEGLDTSRDVILRWLYILKADGTGAQVEFQGHHGPLRVNYSYLDGAEADTAWNEIIDVDAFGDEELLQAETEIDVSFIRPGDLVAFSLTRDAQAGNPDDTFADNVELVNVELFGYFWR